METKPEKGKGTKRIIMMLLVCAISITGLAACKDKNKGEPIQPKSNVESQQNTNNTQEQQQPDTGETQNDNKQESGSQTDTKKEGANDKTKTTGN